MRFPSRGGERDGTDRRPSLFIGNDGRERGVDDVRWLIARELPYLRRCARALVGDPDTADELVQDAVERALRKRHLWRPGGNLRGWLYRLMYNVMVNRKKDRPGVERFAVPIEAVAERGQPAGQETRVEARAVAEALHRLPFEQRAAIVLTGLEGLSYDEAAFALGIPVGTLRSRIHRGRAGLRAAQMGSERRSSIRRVK